LTGVGVAGEPQLLARLAGSGDDPHEVGAIRTDNYSLSEMVSRAGRASPQCEDVRVRPLVASDIASVAALHAEALSHGFFASLGPSYLRTYYRSFLASPYACALAAGPEGGPVGFVVGVLDPVAHRRFTVHHYGARMAVQGGLALLRHPNLGLEFLCTRLGRYTSGLLRSLRPRRVGPPSPQHQSLHSRLGVLSHVAVVPAVRGSGIGEALVDGFVGSARRSGVRRLELLTLGDGLGATRFYDRLGWRCEGVVMDDGREYAKFGLDLE
jgi:ribosomal protein S18 acetylase RimI-like enzyme